MRLSTLVKISSEFHPYLCAVKSEDLDLFLSRFSRLNRLPTTAANSLKPQSHTSVRTSLEFSSRRVSVMLIFLGVVARPFILCSQNLHIHHETYTAASSFARQPLKSTLIHQTYV